jgi:hypothetical protein
LLTQANGSRADFVGSGYVSFGDIKSEGSILALDLDNDPVLPFWRNIKLFGRLLHSFLFVGSLNRAETLGAMPEDIDAPAGH